MQLWIEQELWDIYVIHAALKGVLDIVHGHISLQLEKGDEHPGLVIR